MIARTEMSSNITHCLCYGQNHEKGGECFFSQDLDPTLSPEKQAKDWERLSNNYKRNICHIIISFSDSDTKKLRNMHPAEMVRREREIIMAFFKELKNRGNDITESPYAVFHHGNTDNEHFHIYVLMTTRQGKRWNNSFIRKNAIRSAAKVSLDFGLEGSRKAMMRELAHQHHVNGNSSSHTRRQRSYSNDQQTINERMYRAERIREAETRKANYRHIIENVVACKSEGIKEELRKFGIELFNDPSFGVSMRAIGKDGKERRYALKKHLGVSDKAIEKLKALQLPSGYVRVSDEKKSSETKKTVKHSGHVYYSSQMPRNSKVSSDNGCTASIPNVNVGSHGGTTMAGDVNPDGTRSINEDDLDEQWRRRNGYHR